MPVRIKFVLLITAVLFPGLALRLQAQLQQDLHAQSIVRTAVQTELDADRDDHSHWRYRSLNRKPDGESLYQVVETDRGEVKKKVRYNGQPLTPDQLKAEDARIQSFIHDPSQQAKQRKDGERNPSPASHASSVLMS